MKETAGAEDVVDGIKWKNARAVVPFLNGYRAHYDNCIIIID